MSVNVLVNGAAGRMGKVTVAAIEQHPHLQLVGKAGRSDDLAAVIASTNAQVVVDFTTADSVFANAKTMIAAGVHAVIGASGLLPAQVQELQQLAELRQLGGIIAPNFCIGAVLMMMFAAQAAKYFPRAEIIELHHDKKRDAPSGTAIKSAEMIAAVRDNQTVTCHETLAGACGASLNNVPIHSVRLEGLLAHQEILFGTAGELLTIRHDSFNRQAFMQGVCLACEKVTGLDRWVYGLEHLL